MNKNISVEIDKNVKELNFNLYDGPKQVMGFVFDDHFQKKVFIRQRQFKEKSPPKNHEKQQQHLQKRNFISEQSRVRRNILLRAGFLLPTAGMATDRKILPHLQRQHLLLPSDLLLQRRRREQRQIKRGGFAKEHDRSDRSRRDARIKPHRQLLRLRGPRHRCGSGVRHHLERVHHREDEIEKKQGARGEHRHWRAVERRRSV